MSVEDLLLPESHHESLIFVPASETGEGITIDACVNITGYVALMTSSRDAYEDFLRTATRADLMINKGRPGTYHYANNSCIKTFLSYEVIDPLGDLTSVDEANQRLQVALFTHPFGLSLLRKFLDDPLSGPETSLLI